MAVNGTKQSEHTYNLPNIYYHSISKEQVNKANYSYPTYLHAHVQHETTAVLYKNTSNKNNLSEEQEKIWSIIIWSDF